MLVSAMSSQLWPSGAAGSLNFTTSCQLLKTRSMPKQRVFGSSHSAVLISAPEVLIQATSLTPSSSLNTPERKRFWRRIGYLWRSPVSFFTKRIRRSSDSSRVQSTQEISLSWQYALLLPCCVRPNSSPASIIGVPCDSSSVASRFFIWRLRRPLIAGSSVGPSAPWFHERLFELPSWLFSPFASLCLSLYETRSFSVKPSCAVMKLTLDQGWRPRCWKQSGEAQRRGASALALASPRQ